MDNKINVLRVGVSNILSADTICKCNYCGEEFPLNFTHSCIPTIVKRINDLENRIKELEKK